MSRVTWSASNQWRWLRDGCEVDVFRLSCGANRWRVGVSVTVLGFGVGLTWWRMVIPVESLGREHGA